MRIKKSAGYRIYTDINNLRPHLTIESSTSLQRQFLALSCSFVFPAWHLALHLSSHLVGILYQAKISV